MRWLHLSDLHFGRLATKYNSERQTWNSLVAMVRQRSSEGLGPDYVFITGDIAWSASDENYELTKERLLALFDAAGFPVDDAWGRLFVVPGNHDVCQERSNYPAAGPRLHARWNRSRPDNSRLKAAKRHAEEVLVPNKPILVPRLENYRRFMKSICAQRKDLTFITDELTYYSIIRKPGGRVAAAVIGINTAWACYDSKFDNQPDAIPCGKVLVAKAIKEAKESNPPLLILLGHHPTKSIYDFEAVKESCGSTPTVYLRGHQHQPRSGQEQNTVSFIEIGASACHLDIYRKDQRPHGVMWGSLEDGVILFEPMVENRERTSFWTIDPTPWPERAFQGHRLRGKVGKHNFDVPLSPESNLYETEFVGVGLAALGTMGILNKPFDEKKDCKVDFNRLWEPELGTFATIVCRALNHWEPAQEKYNRAALITSMGDDENGLLLRQVLKDRNIPLLFCRARQKTGRQISLTPENENFRYNMDDQVRREGGLTELELRRLDAVLDKIVQTKCIAFDKYELDIVEHIFKSTQWGLANRRPMVLFETGSRSLPETRAGLPRTSYPELKLLEYVDLFTTTWEWTRAWAEHEAPAQPWNGKHPDKWTSRELKKSWAAYKQFVTGDIFGKLLRREHGRSRIVWITLSKVGSCLLYRNGNDELEAELIRVKREAKTIYFRQNVGDMVRAAFIEAYLRGDVSREDLEVDFSKNGKERVIKTIELAQYVAGRWMRHVPQKEYFAGFEEDFIELMHGYENDHC